MPKSDVAVRLLEAFGKEASGRKEERRGMGEEIRKETKERNKLFERIGMGEERN